MSVRLKRMLGACVTTAGLIGLVAGCGTTTGSPVAAGDDSSQTTSSTANSAKARELVLDASAFPAGYTVQEVPRDQTQKMMDMILESTRSADVTPSHCLQLSAIPASVDADELGLVVATKGAEATIAEGVSVSMASIDEYRAQVSGECAHLTMDMDVQGQSVKGTVDQKVVDGPKTSVDDTLVVEMTTVSEVGTRSVTQHMVLGYAAVNGYTVSVQATAMSPSGAVDRAGFDEVFTKAVHKAVGQT
ncbi:hypothetical protein L5G32_15200 [Gordonia sp. HY002]|uniref:hypothetical protein n=1 Tax=Gordonia zhenghanii TaxID=2911516 RepID=UPI001EEFDA0A|nr:hypothetical protein [Gordonia zhenghanii]MCF8571618.1 hypothetical protein [Gordonia zhenghanii]MCF8602215.1 hypothetical protein [Gordonia zhenghanii]